MRLVEGIGGKLLPFAPNLLQDRRIVTILLSTGDKLRLQGIQLILEFLTHRLTQGIRLATCKVSQQTRQQHDLLLIDRNTIRIFQVTLHDIDIVDNR